MFQGQKRKGLGASVLGVLGGGFVAWCILCAPATMAQPKKIAASPVVAEKVIQKRVRPMVTLIGTARPYRKSLVAPEVEGLVVNFPVRVGQRIREGDLLVKVEARPLLLELKFAKANLAEAKEKYQDAVSELKRAERLFNKKSISSGSYDDARYAANALKERIVALQAKVDGIQYDIEKCAIRAPFDGFVVKEHTQVGQWLKKGGEVVTIVNIDPILVAMPVPDRYIHFLEQGQEVALEFDCLSQNGIRKGNVQDIIPQGNEKARTFPVQIRVPNQDFSILAGMSCRVNIPVGEAYEALLVHKDAVITTPTGHHVFVVRDGKAYPVPIKKGRSYGSCVVVEGKISANDMVVVEGNERLQPQQRVRLIKREEG